jgi:cell division protein FtsB
MASHAQYQKLTEKYSKLCSDMENIVAENRILRRLHGVPENFGFDLEEIKIAEKQELEDYKTQVKHLEAEVEELEAERTQLRYRLRQFNTLYSNKGERYKDFTPEQFELLD